MFKRTPEQDKHILQLMTVDDTSNFSILEIGLIHLSMAIPALRKSGMTDEHIMEYLLNFFLEHGDGSTKAIIAKGAASYEELKRLRKERQQ